MWKHLIVLQCFVMIIMSSCAQELKNPLTELPLGIILGETHFSEFEDKGNCFIKEKLNKDHYRCKTIKITDGNYSIRMDNEEIAKALVFSDENNLNKASVLPDNWKKIGLFLRKDGKSNGTLRKDFMSIIKELNVKNIEESTESKGKYVVVKFTIDNYTYSAIFREYSSWHFEPGFNVISYYK